MVHDRQQVLHLEFKGLKTNGFGDKIIGAKLQGRKYFVLILQSRYGKNGYVEVSGAPSQETDDIKPAFPAGKKNIGNNQVRDLFLKLGDSFFKIAGERYPVSVAIVGSTPLFDPENERVRS